MKIYLLLMSLLLLIATACCPQKAINKHKKEWIAELVSDTVRITEYVPLEPVTVTDTLSIVKLMHDTSYVMQPVFVTDTANKVRMKYWKDRYKTLYITCSRLPDTITVYREKITFVDPPVKIEDREGVGWYWKLIIALGIVALILGLIKTIIK